jgi:type IV secretion system protein VirB1
VLLGVIALAGLIHACAPRVSLATMSAIVQVESGGDPLALHDNTRRQSFAPVDLNEAVSWATTLIGYGDSVDLGLSQVNSRNLPFLGLSVAAAFEPCTNLRAGATILGADYASAAGRFGAGQYALRRALGAYNSGSLYAGDGYIDRILVAAGLPPEHPAAPPVVAANAPSTHRSRPLVKLHASAAFYTTETTPGSGVVVIIGTP